MRILGKTLDSVILGVTLSTMKFVKKPISLPPDLYRHGLGRVRDLKKQRGGRVSFSGFMAELLADDKRRMSETTKQSLAA